VRSEDGARTGGGALLTPCQARTTRSSCPSARRHPPSCMNDSFQLLGVRAGRLATPAGSASEIDRLGDRQGVIKLDTEVADRAVHLDMTEQ
jgi:hypothetical protein